VTYEINAYCDDPHAMMPLYTELHRQILDVFNEYGVQIMTPAYEGDPAQPKVVQKSTGTLRRPSRRPPRDRAEEGGTDAQTCSVADVQPGPACRLRQRPIGRGREPEAAGQRPQGARRPSARLARCVLPPGAPAPVFLARMTEQAGAFSGMVLRLNEGNRREAKVLFDRFKAQYTANAGLVPEWQQAFAMQPVEELGALVEQAEPAKVMEAVGKVGAVCHACHVLNMPRTQQDTAGASSRR